jgi:hypothetical protein
VRVPEEGARVVLRALAAALGGQEVRKEERTKRALESSF